MNATLPQSPHRYALVNRAGCTIGLVSALMLGSTAPAQTASTAVPPTATSELQLTFTPGVWLTRVNGESSFGPAGTTFVLEQDLNLDEHEAAFGAELAIVKNNMWRIGISGFHFSTESEGTFVGGAQFGDLTINNADPFTASFDLTSIAVDFGFWMWEPYTIGPQENGEDSRLGLRAGPMLGVRYVDLDQSIAVSGVGSEETGGEWLAPCAGMHLEITYDTPDSFPVIDSFVIDASAMLGPALGGDGGIVTYFHAGMTGYVTPNIGIGLEYRLIHLDVEGDEYEFDGGLQGLFFFASLRF